MEKLKKLLIRHEGLTFKPYRDTRGFLTIGVGRNLEAEGITHREAIILLENDINHISAEARHAFPWFAQLNEARQHVVLSMIFNLGFRGFSNFKKTIAAIEKRDYEFAAAEMLRSDWASQVGARANELSQMMRTGFYKDDHN